MYPRLSLDRVTIDEDVARRLPRRLAYYHLALPIAEDEDSISVAMAYPDNQAVVKLIEGVLHATIIPVYSTGEQIRAALQRLWGDATSEATARILTWNESSDGTDWSREYAKFFAPLLEAEVEAIAYPPKDVETLLEDDTYSLVVCPASGSPLPTLLRHKSRSSLLLVRGAFAPLRNILVILRGHAPDLDVLNRIFPLAALGNSSVTVLAVAPGANGSGRINMLANQFGALLSPETPQGEHVQACVQAVKRAGLHGYLRIRQGNADEEIAEEVASNDYSIVAIAAEAHGDFVSRTLSAIQRKAPTNTSAVLVIKA